MCRVCAYKYISDIFKKKGLYWNSVYLECSYFGDSIQIQSVYDHLRTISIPLCNSHTHLSQNMLRAD